MLDDAAVLDTSSFEGGAGVAGLVGLIGLMPSLDEVVSGRGSLARQQSHLRFAADHIEKAAATELDHKRRADLRAMSDYILAMVGEKPTMGFNLLEGFSMTGHQFIDTVFDRIQGKPRWKDAMVVLWGLVRHLDYKDPEVKFERQADLANYVGLPVTHLSGALTLLEEIGAIKRVKEGNRKRIYLNPEGVYRGKLKGHAATVQRYAAMGEPLREAS